MIRLIRKAWVWLICHLPSPNRRLFRWKKNQFEFLFSLYIDYYLIVTIIHIMFAKVSFSLYACSNVNDCFTLFFQRISVWRVWIVSNCFVQNSRNLAPKRQKTKWPWLDLVRTSKRPRLLPRYYRFHLFAMFTTVSIVIFLFMINYHGRYQYSFVRCNIPVWCFSCLEHVN